jgi:hypothetical protein
LIRSGALAFYLGNQKQIDANLTEGQHLAEAQQQSRRTNAELIAQATAGASCESDFRLTPTLMAA